MTVFEEYFSKYMGRREGFEMYNPQGGWNGYGYERLPLAVKISSSGEMRRFNKIKQEIENSKKVGVPKKDASVAWAERLAKLTGITVQQAMRIAQIKLDYKQEQIEKLEEKQVEHHSLERAKLIRSLRKENPLRRIENEEHAKAILAAHHRHRNTNYEYMLELAKEKAVVGEIDRSEIKDYARQNYN